LLQQDDSIARLNATTSHAARNRTPDGK